VVRGTLGPVVCKSQDTSSLGVEVDHRDNPPARRTQLRALADRLDLIVIDLCQSAEPAPPIVVTRPLTRPRCWCEIGGLVFACTR